MRIITRLKLAQYLCLAVAAVLAVLLLVTNARMRGELARNERAGEIQRAVVALRYLSMEYTLGHGARARGQWLLRKDSLAALLLRDDLFREDEEGQLLRDLQESLPLLARHFSELLRIGRLLPFSNCTT